MKRPAGNALKTIGLAVTILAVLALAGCPSLQHVDSMYGVNVAADGNGGALAVYEDTLGGSIYAQKVDPEGKTVWGDKGIMLGTNGGNSYEYGNTHIVSDGSGGAIVSWYSTPSQSSETGYFHIARLSSQGHFLWEWDVTREDQMKGDSSGGVVLGSSNNGVLYAEVIAPDGKVATVGARIAPSLSQQYLVNLSQWQLVSDGEGGAIVLWDETQYPTGVSPGATTARDHLFAQRVDASGKLLWGQDQNGESVYFTETGTSIDTLEAAGDGDGGVIISWFQSTQAPPNSGGNRSQKLDVVVQKIDADGKVMWGDSGIVLGMNGASPFPSDGTLIAADGSGGAIVAWRDYRNTPLNPSMYAQRIDAHGEAMWQPGGARVSSTSLNPRSIIASDGSGGMIAAYWSQQDNKVLSAQRLDGSGKPLWGQDGVTIAKGSFASFSMAPDSLGGAIIGWGGGKPGAERAFLQRVSPDGGLLWGADGLRLR